MSSEYKTKALGHVTDGNLHPAPGQFEETQWHLVVAAGRGGDTTVSREALEHLCRAYHAPLYAYLRRRGLDRPDAEDLTQGFFAHLLSHDVFGKVTPGKARFRSYLLKSLNHYLADDYDRRRAQKRGGGWTALSLDTEQAEFLYASELRDGDTPSSLYERRWAMTLIDLALARLEKAYRSANREELFHHLRDHLVHGTQREDREELASRLGLSQQAFRKAVQRLRARFREAVRHEIAQTVATPEEVEDEWRHLWSVLS